MRINFVTGPIIKESGLGRYSHEISERYSQEKNIFSLGKKSSNIVSKFSQRYLKYPLKIKKESSSDVLTHITRQDFAYTLCYGKIENSIVTCHDIITHLYPEKNPFFRIHWNFCVKGMRQADALLTDSTNTKKDLIN